MTLKWIPWTVASAALILTTTGCAKKEFPLPGHPGGQIYNGMTRSDVRCYRCHGDEGRGGGRAPALIQNGKTIERDLFLKTVLNGRKNMPPFGSVLKEEDVLQIIDWLEKVSQQ
ncbi:MAG TPA: cytochrome c [Candidatus Manganitrophaceae bacterium]|nr:cytochrome c [Candidatus Manganitrophaceae bacterium]